jgi:hypothetical protein
MALKLGTESGPAQSGLSTPGSDPDGAGSIPAETTLYEMLALLAFFSYR